MDKYGVLCGVSGIWHKTTQNIIKCICCRVPTTTTTKRAIIEMIIVGGIAACITTPMFVLKEGLVQKFGYILMQIRFSWC